MSGTWSVLASAWSVLDPPGYQCTITKSTYGPAIDSTVWFQFAASPAATIASGQFAGVVSIAPILMVGSAAFIAWANATVSRAYPAGLLSAWSSASQLAP